jgi:hypothetical protein
LLFISTGYESGLESLDPAICIELGLEHAFGVEHLRGRRLLNGYPSAVGAQSVEFGVHSVLPDLRVLRLHGGFVGERVANANIALQSISSMASMVSTQDAMASRSLREGFRWSGVRVDI